MIAKGKEVLHTSPLDQRAFEDIKQITAKYEYPSIVEGISSAYVRKSDGANFLNEMYKYYAKIKTINNFNEVSEPVFKVNMSVPVEKTLSIIDDLQKQYPNIEFTAGSADSIDMQPAEMNKAKGLEYLSKTLKINPSEMVAFGDSGNDVEMLKYVGKGYVMSTGMEVAKDAADQIIGKNNDSAVQKEILKLLN